MLPIKTCSRMCAYEQICLYYVQLCIISFVFSTLSRFDRLIWVTIHFVRFELTLFDFYSMFPKNGKNYHSGTQILRLLSYWFILWNHIISCEPIFIYCGILAYLLGCNFLDALVLSFRRKTKYFMITFPKMSIRWWGLPTNTVKIDPPRVLMIRQYTIRMRCIDVIKGLPSWRPYYYSKYF